MRSLPPALVVLVLATACSSDGRIGADLGGVGDGAPGGPAGDGGGPAGDAGGDEGPGGHVPGFGGDAALVYATDYTDRDERADAGGLWGLQYPDDNGEWNEDYLWPVEAPWAPARVAIRATIHAGDDWEGLGYPRSELSQAIHDLVGGTHYYLSFGFEFPLEAEPYLDGNDDESVAGLQLHHPEPYGSPPLGMYLTGRTMKLRCMGGSAENEGFPGDWYELFPPEEVPVGRRVAIDIDYLPRNGPDGFLKLYVDGVLVADHQGACAYTDDGDAGYLKQGLYDYAETVDGELTMFLDDLVIRAE